MDGLGRALPCGAILMALFGCGSPRPQPVPPTKVEPARPRIAVDLLDGDARSVALESLRADTTVIALWASYCSSCTTKLVAVQRLAEQYRDDPSVSVILISADSEQQHERARSVLAEIAPNLTSYYVARESDVYPLLPRRPSGTPVVSLPMTLVIDAKGTWHYTYGGAGSDEEYIAQHRKLVSEAQRGTLAAATDPPPRTVAIEIRPNDGTGYRFKVVRAPNDNAKIVEAILGIMRDALGYPEQSLEDARREIERGLVAGRVEFAFDLPLDSAMSGARSSGSQ